MKQPKNVRLTVWFFILALLLSKRTCQGKKNTNYVHKISIFLSTGRHIRTPESLHNHAISAVWQFIELFYFCCFVRPFIRLLYDDEGGKKIILELNSQMYPIATHMIFCTEFISLFFVWNIHTSGIVQCCAKFSIIFNLNLIIFHSTEKEKKNRHRFSLVSRIHRNKNWTIWKIIKQRWECIRNKNINVLLWRRSFFFFFFHLLLSPKFN